MPIFDTRDFRSRTRIAGLTAGLMIGAGIGLTGCAQSASSTTTAGPEAGPVAEPVVVEAPPWITDTITIPGSTTTFDLIWINQPTHAEGGYWMAKTETTWDAFLLFCAFDENPPEGYNVVSRPSKPLEVAPAHRDWGLGARPAVSVSRNAAIKYCEWLTLLTGDTYRLPTEDEWSFACGASPPAPITDHAWCSANSDQRTQPTASKKPNRFGLHDMLGNLWEYCSNPYSPDEPTRAVLRGGSWQTPAAELSPELRLRFDDDWILDDPNYPPGVWWVPDGSHLGFRVLREHPSTTEGTP